MPPLKTPKIRQIVSALVHQELQPHSDRTWDGIDLGAQHQEKINLLLALSLHERKV